VLDLARFVPKLRTLQLGVMSNCLGVWKVEQAAVLNRGALCACMVAIAHMEKLLVSTPCAVSFLELEAKCGG
jgi:hypothetical protein